MSDKNPISPYEQLQRWGTTRGYQPITWLMILAGLLHLTGDLVMSITDVLRYFDGLAGRVSLAEILATFLHRLGYSLWIFGTAATVEFLFRIWTELRIRRLPPGDKPS